MEKSVENRVEILPHDRDFFRTLGIQIDAVERRLAERFEGKKLELMQKIMRATYNTAARLTHATDENFNWDAGFAFDENFNPIFDWLDGPSSLDALEETSRDIELPKLLVEPVFEEKKTLGDRIKNFFARGGKIENSADQGN